MSQIISSGRSLMYCRESAGLRMEGTHLRDLIFQWFIFLGFFYQRQVFVKVIIVHKWLHIIVKNRSWLLNSSKATNWYNHPCYDNITLATFKRSEISRSESILFAQSKNIAWTRKLVLEIASKVHYLVLFFLLHSVSSFLHLNSFSYYLMSCNRVVSVEWCKSSKWSNPK